MDSRYARGGSSTDARIARRVWWRWSFLAAVGLGCGYLALVVVANLLVERALASLGSGELRVSARRAWTWFPLRVELEELRVSPRRADWVMRAERMTVCLKAGPLFRGRIVLDTVRAPVTEVQLEHRLLSALQSSSRAMLRGGMTLQASGVRHERGVWTADDGKVVFRESALSADAGVVAFIAGEVGLLRGREGVSVQLRGARKRAAPADWTAQATTGLDADEPLEGELRTHHAWSWSRRGAEVSFSPPAVLSIAGSAAAGFDVRLAIPQLVARGRAGWLAFPDVRLAYHQPLPGMRGELDMNVRITAADATFALGTEDRSFHSRVEVSFDLHRKRSDGWTVTDATARLPRVHGQAAPSEGTTPLAVRIEAEELRFWGDLASLRASFVVEGERLDALSELLPLPEAARLVLSPFDAAPFVARGAITGTPSQLTLGGVTITSSRLRARGFAHGIGSTMRGALLVEVPLGTVAMTFGDEEDRDVIWNPPAEWLERRELGPGLLSTSHD